MTRSERVLCFKPAPWQIVALLPPYVIMIAMTSRGSVQPFLFYTHFDWILWFLLSYLVDQLSISILVVAAPTLTAAWPSPRSSVTCKVLSISRLSNKRYPVFLQKKVFAWICYKVLLAQFPSKTRDTVNISRPRLFFFVTLQHLQRMNQELRWSICHLTSMKLNSEPQSLICWSILRSPLLLST